MAKSLQSLIDMVEGLLAISFTDRDGNTIVSAATPRDSVVQQMLKSEFPLSLSFASEQGAKINVGTCKSVIFEFGGYIIVSLFHSKVTTTFVATAETSVGEILNLEHSIIPLVDIFTNMIDHSTAVL